MSNKDRLQMFLDFGASLSSKTKSFVGMDVVAIQDQVLSDLGITQADIEKVKTRPEELQRVITRAYSKLAEKLKNNTVKNSIVEILQEIQAATSEFNAVVDSINYRDNPKLAIKRLAEESEKLQKVVEAALVKIENYNADEDMKRAVKHFIKATQNSKLAFDEQVRDLQSFEKLTKMAVKQRANQFVSTLVSVTLFAVSIPLGALSIIPSFFGVGFMLLAYGATKDRYASKEEARFNLGKVFEKDTSRYTSDRTNKEYKSTWNTWQQVPLPKSVKNVISSLALGISSLCVCMKKRTDATNEVTNRNPTSPRSRRA